MAIILPVKAIFCECGHMTIVNYVYMDDVTCECGKVYTVQDQEEILNDTTKF